MEHTTKSSTVLELHDVSHVYPNGNHALDHVMLSIPRGLYGLLGPNGAGKSTLIRTIDTLQNFLSKMIFKDYRLLLFLILTFVFTFVQPNFSYSQTSDSLSKYDQILLKESFQLANQLQDSIWSGWSSAPMGLLLVKSDHEYLINHSRPSQDFKNIGYNSFLEDSVYMRKRQFPTDLRATFPAVGGIPTIVIGLPDSSESPTDWVLTVLHEHFHQWQMSRPDYYSSVDSLGLSGDDNSGQWMLNYPFPYDSTKVINAFNELVIDLKATVESTDEPDFKKKLKIYLSTRKKFQDILTPADYRYFSFQLWQEGVSRYIEYKTAKVASSQYLPSKDFKKLDGYESFENVSGVFLNRIISRLSTLSLERDKRVAFYPIGAAEAILLDHVNPDWQKLYWKKKFYLEKYFKSSF